MRAIGGTIIAAALGAIACLCGTAAAQQNMTLPDVTVTAPSNTIPPSTTAANPYFGKTRVEEATWPSIPCSTSRIGAAAAGDCRRGPSVVNFEHGDSQGNRALSNCQIAHDLVIGVVGGVNFEADSLVFDPYYVSAIGHQRQDCYVEARPSTLHDQLIDMNHVTRQATRWGALSDSGDLSSIDFSVGPDYCLAFEKRGPRWGGGYVWLIHAAICRRDGRPIDPSNVETVLNALQVRQKDATGNLR
jgi:hypothetical protein